MVVVLHWHKNTVMKNSNSFYLPSFFAVMLVAVSTTGQVVDWANNGNTLTANGTLGTNSNHSLLFETNGLERMRLDNAGSFGLNTTTMTARLNVKHGWGHWLSLQGTNGSEWTLHNPSAQDALVLYSKPSGGSLTIY